MAGRGGKRPGAGRKPKRLDPVTLSPIRAAELTLAKNLPQLVEMALSLALEDRDKAMVVYCMDRVLGKPTQPVDVYDTARQIAVERGLDPEKVVSIYDGLKKKRAV